MAYATVMVSLALDQPNEFRLEVAAQLAERFEAALVGIAAAQFAPPMYFADGEQAQRLIDQGQASLKQRLARLEEQFRSVTRQRSRQVEWRGAMDYPLRYVLQQARCADIVVSGGRSPAVSDAFALASPKDVVMQAGRPVLVVPDGIDWLDLRSVLVAWKDTAEARRAIADALPLLRKARDVTVMEIPEAEGGRVAAAAGVRDVVGWLSRHGITATEQVPEAGGKDATRMAEEVAGAMGASLIVAGAYGHSRFRETILGGMTERLVTQTARCALLSH
jgi:nucleotide-binding universal stress UspA family protein